VTRARLRLAVIAATLALAAPALAQSHPAEPLPVTISTLPDASGASSDPFKVGNLIRPAMLGLIAALFLICGALVANDKHGHGHGHGHGPPRSRR
jgi:hypothetical protein